MDGGNTTRAQASLEHQIEDVEVNSNKNINAISDEVSLKIAQQPPETRQPSQGLRKAIDRKGLLRIPDFESCRTHLGTANAYEADRRRAATQLTHETRTQSVA